MQKIVMFFKRSLICLILSFSLVCNNTAAVTYQAAAIPVVYSAWEVFVTIFALLGITLSIADTVDAKLEAARELQDEFVGWKVLKGEGQGDNDGDGKDDLYAVFDPLEWLQGDNLTIPEEDLNDWQDFAREQGWSPNYKAPADAVNLYDCSYQEFLDYFCSLYNLSTSITNENKFLENTYNIWKDNGYTGLFCFTDSPNLTNSQRDYIMYFNLTSDFYYSWVEEPNFTQLFFYRNTSRAYANQVLYYDLNGNVSYQSNTGYTFSTYDPYSATLFVNGILYDFDSIFQKPDNLTTGKDYGNKVYLSDFVVPDNHFGDTVKDNMNSIGDINLGDLVTNGDYDVIGGGRDYDSDNQQAVGDITVTMPSGDVLTDYQNGLITYEQLLDKLGLTPIDESSGTNLITQELLNTNTGILSGIDKLVDFVGGLFEGLIEMFSRLFIPEAGYFESYFTRINDFFDSRLGFLYTPFDLLIRFLSFLPSVDHSSTQLYFPGLKFQEYVLCEPMYVELNLRNEFPALYRYMYFITDTTLIAAVLWLLQSKTKELIKG